jgi:hypothetical protein
MEISLTDRIKNEELLHTVQERNILQIKKKKAAWLRHTELPSKTRYGKKDRRKD